MLGRETGVQELISGRKGDIVLGSPNDCLEGTVEWWGLMASISREQWDFREEQVTVVGSDNGKK